MAADENSKLYRQEAIDGQKASTLGQIVLLSPAISVWLTWLIVGITIVLLAFIVAGSYTKKTMVIGQVQPLGGVIKVYAPQSGQIKTIATTQGEQVEQGQRLLEISSGIEIDSGQAQKQIIDTIQDQKRTLDKQEIELAKQINNYQTQWQMRQNVLTQQEKTISQQVSLLNQQQQLSGNSVSRYQELANKGYISLEEAERKKNENLSIDIQLSRLQTERQDLSRQQLELQTEYDRQMDSYTQRQSSIADQKSELDANLVQAKSQQASWISAPQKGMVETLLISQGQQVNPNKPLLTIVPIDAKYQVELYAQSNQIGFIEVGQRVYLRYQAYPYQKFGQYPARITNISKVALPANEIGDHLRAFGDANLYRIEATPETQYIQAYGNQEPLIAGMQVEADIEQENRKIYEWIIDPLLTITGKL